jgi:hypothetical protein
MSRIITSITSITSITALGLLVASPVHAQDPGPGPTSAPFADTVPEGPGLEGQAVGGTKAEVDRLRTRAHKSRVAVFSLLGASAILLGAAGGVMGGNNTQAFVTRNQMLAGISLVGIGIGVALSAIIPGVIGRRARKQADRLETGLALRPAGWVGRGTAGVGLTLRF